MNRALIGVALIGAAAFLGWQMFQAQPAAAAAGGAAGAGAGSRAGNGRAAGGSAAATNGAAAGQGNGNGAAARNGNGAAGGNGNGAGARDRGSHRSRGATIAETDSPVLLEVMKLAGHGPRGPWQWNYFYNKVTGKTGFDPFVIWPGKSKEQIQALRITPEEWWGYMQQTGLGALRGCGCDLPQPIIGGNFRGYYVRGYNS